MVLPGMWAAMWSFSRYEYFNRLLDDLLGGERLEHQRVARVRMAERWLRAFQNNIRHLPKDLILGVRAGAFAGAVRGPAHVSGLDPVCFRSRHRPALHAALQFQGLGHASGTDAVFLDRRAGVRGRSGRGAQESHFGDLMMRPGGRTMSFASHYRAVRGYFQPPCGQGDGSRMRLNADVVKVDVDAKTVHLADGQRVEMGQSAEHRATGHARA